MWHRNNNCYTDFNVIVAVRVAVITRTAVARHRFSIDSIGLVGLVDVPLDESELDQVAEAVLVGVVHHVLVILLAGGRKCHVCLCYLNLSLRIS